jgi:HAD superfamily hydrolase (TIGR01662 family)
MPISTVFFDLGDTLWHFPKMPPRDIVRGQTMKQLAALLQGWGEEISGERRMLGRDIRFAIEEETHQAFHGDCVDPNYPEICRRIAKMHGLDLTPRQGDELWDAWNLGGMFLGRALFPGVIQTLEELRRRGYRLAAVTNRGYGGSKFLDEVRELGLESLFEMMAVSCDVGYLKPHPRIYQYAIERMGVEASECAMVGDNWRADVEGAKTLGLTTVWFRPPANEPIESATDEPELTGPITPDYSITRIPELLDLPILQDRA